MESHKVGKSTLIQNGTNVYLFDVVGADKLAQPSLLPFYTTTRQLKPVRINGFDIIPYGEYNNYPDEIRQMLDENNLTPEILLKQTQLLWGQGPALYKQEFDEKGILKRTFVSNPEIEKWLKSWNYEEYLLKASVEFRHINGHFTKYYRNLGFRIGGKPQIAKLEHVSSLNARLEWPYPDINDGTVMHILTADFYQPWRSGIKSFQVFDINDPFKAPVMMNYSNMYSFALNNEYSRSAFHGSFNWIKLSSSLAKLLNNFNLNSAAIKYHIKVPAAYWEKAAAELETKATNEGKQYTPKMLEDYKDEVFIKVTKALSGNENVGKLISTEGIFDDEAGEYKDWVIDVMDQKVKDFIEAQIAIAKRAAFETSSGLGMHPALSNITHEGNLPSGSEQLYAFKLYLNTGIQIPEMIVCRDINNAIAVNFPNSDLKLGFYHSNVISEEQTNPEQRIKNN